MSNRGARIFARALAPLGGRPYEEGDEHIDLLYFDRYGGKTPPPGPSVGSTLIDRQLTIPLDHKAKMAQTLLEQGVSIPAVYFQPDQVPGPPERLWYLKNPLATAGAGIEVVTQKQVPERFQEGWIIQEAVEDLALVDGRKFTLRLYLLVQGGKLWLFPDGFMVVHAASYTPGSLDARVQFDHSGYIDKQAAVELRPFVDFSQCEQVMARLRAKLASVFSAFAPLWAGQEPRRYCVFGVDLLVRRDLSTALIEINDRPNFVHTELINSTINIPMVRALYAVLNPAATQQMPASAPRFDPLTTF